jgi:hypothetical protein
MNVLGIDPAKNLAKEANEKGLETIPEFFTEEQAKKMMSQYGQFNLITANNVFAHCPDLIDFAKGVKMLLAPQGVFSFEVSYFADVCDKTLFDTIYHEHSSYHTIKPLITFFRKYNLELFKVKHIENHGGSIRAFVCNKEDYGHEYYGLKDELLRNTPFGPISSFEMHNSCIPEYLIDKKVELLQKQIKYLGLELREQLKSIKDQNKSIAIYGMPAKATTLLYALGINEEWIDFAVDDASLKIGTYAPGKHIEIFPPDEIYKRNPDVLLVLGWNFAESIIEKHSKFTGKWIVPLPILKVV